MAERISASPDIQLFRDVFNASPIGIAVENLDGQPLFVNPAFCRFLGFTEEELKRKHCVDFSPKEDGEKDWALFQRLRAGSIDHYQLEKRYFRRDGSLVWGRLSLSLLNNRLSPLVIAMVEDITDKKGTEESLREGEERLRLAAQAGRMFAYSWDAATDVIQRSGESEAILGVKSDQAASGAAISAMVHPDDKQRLEAALSNLKVENPTLQITYRLIRPDGAVAWLERNSRAYFDEQGKLKRVVGMIADVTERKRAEEIRFRHAAVIESSDDAIATGTLDGNIVSWNAGAQKIYGYTEAEAVGKPINMLVPPELQDEENKILETLRSGESIEHLETIRVNKTGKRINVSLTISPIKDSSGRIVGISGIARDISDRKKHEERLREYERAVENAEEMITVVDREYRYLIANRQFLKMRNMSQEQVVGHFANNVLNEGIFETLVKPKLDECFQGKVVRYEMKYTYPELGERDLLISYFPIEGAGGIDRVVCILQDVTEQKRAEKDLLSSEERYRLLFEKNVAGVGIATSDGRVLDCNDGWAHILGYQSREEIRGRLTSEFYFNPADRQSVLDELSEKHVLRSRRLQLKRKDGSPVWVLFNGATLHVASSTPIGQATMIDISEWKQAEEALSGMTRKLIESQEQERSRIGRELHDDINQRLAMLAVELEQPLDAAEFQNRVQRFREELREISDDVQALSHDLHSTKLEYLSVVAGMKSWCKEFAERQKMDVDFRSDVRSVLPLDVGRPLFRVLQEALHNAVKHSGVKRFEVELHAEAGEIHLTIRDLGKGFDIEAARQGKGLGLTSMRERVRLVNGTITIESKPMAGTTIHVRVPIDPEQGAQREAV